MKIKTDAGAAAPAKHPGVAKDAKKTAAAAGTEKPEKKSAVAGKKDHAGKKPSSSAGDSGGKSGKSGKSGRGGDEKKQSLLDDGDGEEEQVLRINPRFAREYETRKVKEEMSNLRKDMAKNNSDGDDDDDDSESEDSDAELLTADVDKKIFETLAAIKAKDPKIYKPDVVFFDSKMAARDSDDDDDDNDNDDDNGGGAKDGKKQKKKLTLKELQVNTLLTKGPEAFGESDSEDELVKQKERLASRNPKAYNEEQNALRSEFLSAIRRGEAEEDDLLQPRTKSKDEEEKETRDFEDWLKGEEKALKSAPVSELETLRRYWNNPQLDPKEKFLRDYILNHGWKDRKGTRIPTYEEVVGGKKGKGAAAAEPTMEEDVDDDEDAEAVERAEEFEAKHNFRYEEAGASSLVSYPRTIDDSIRTRETKRAERRARAQEARKQRKEEEMQRKKRLRELQSMMLTDRSRALELIAELNASSGGGGGGSDQDDEKARINRLVSELDLEKDFDPAEYDRKLAEIYNDDFYQSDIDLSKVPTAGIVGENDVNYDTLDPLAAGNEDEGAVQGDGPDADKSSDAEAAEGDSQTSKKKKKSAKKSEKAARTSAATTTTTTTTSAAEPKKAKRAPFLQMLREKQRPKFEDSGLSFGEYIDKYYLTEFEDLIAGQPTYFKYRETKAQDYGLSTEDILSADEKELNTWLSLRKVTGYLSDEQEEHLKSRYKKKTKNKKQIIKHFSSIYGGEAPKGAKALPASSAKGNAKAKPAAASDTGHAKQGKSAAAESERVGAFDASTRLSVKRAAEEPAAGDAKRPAMSSKPKGSNKDKEKGKGKAKA